ncbi:hypothetical protein NDU88_005797 [Pleurodeles waltl]|uniref:Uncharacterized protein n=1 Tax=Pleurodeles waltl TaxID=8319 RepID=A0AAV7MXC4_PLEWA|nr:hypothetical protein NDU88_005797 [Pleurodeles waltl]
MERNSYFEINTGSVNKEGSVWTADKATIQVLPKQSLSMQTGTKSITEHKTHILHLEMRAGYKPDRAMLGRWPALEGQQEQDPKQERTSGSGRPPVTRKKKKEEAEGGVMPGKGPRESKQTMLLNAGLISLDEMRALAGAGPQGTDAEETCIQSEVKKLAFE